MNFLKVNLPFFELTIIGPFSVVVYGVVLQQFSFKNDTKKHSRPCLDQQADKARAPKAQLFKRARKVNNSDSWMAFKTHRNIVSKLISHSYHTYVNKVIGNSLSEQPKRFLSYIKTSNTENIDIPTLIEK